MTGAGGEGPSVLRLGLLGCADVALRRVLPTLRQLHGVELVAVASRDPARAERVAEQFGGRPMSGYDRLLAATDVDAVYLPLPTGLHGHWAARALAAGRHVLVEKPLTTTSAETERLHERAQRAGLVLRENYMFLHHRLHDRVATLLAEGVIGELRSFHAAFAVPARPPGDIRHRADLGGGALFDCGGYPVRAAIRFLGTDLAVVGAHLRVNPALGVDLAGSALLRTAAGVPVHCEFGLDHYYTSGYRFLGTRGRLRVSHVFTTPVNHHPVIEIDRDGASLRETVAPDDQFRNSLAAFQSDIRQGRAGTTDATRVQARFIDEVRAAARR